MKIIYNNVIPFKGFKCINLFGVLFVRKDAVTPLTDITINHEKIHSAQMKEMLYIPFYIWYIIEHMFRMIQFKDNHEAYRNISFEKEAYENQNNLVYLSNRKKYTWLIKYLK